MRTVNSMILKYGMASLLCLFIGCDQVILVEDKDDKACKHLEKRKNFALL